MQIIDLNPALIVELLGSSVKVSLGDYFDGAEAIPNAVLMTASNRKWTFGGGIDMVFKQKFPELIAEKQAKGGDMERIGNIVFAITVGDNYKATPEIVEKAIRFALSQIRDGEELVISGVGTGIGGLSIREFAQIIKKIQLP